MKLAVALSEDLQREHTAINMDVCFLKQKYKGARLHVTLIEAR